MRYKAELEVVHVIIADTGLTRDRQSTDELRELAADLGARWHEIQQDDPAQAIVGFARQREITQIVIGPIHRSWWYIAVGGPVVRRVIEEAGASGIDVLIIVRPRAAPGGDPRSECRPQVLTSHRSRHPRRRMSPGYAGSDSSRAGSSVRRNDPICTPDHVRGWAVRMMR